MRLTQTLPILFSTAPVDARARTGAWRAASGCLSRVIALARKWARTESDNSRLSADTLRDIGLVRGEPPYVGAWEQCRMDYRL